MRPSVCAGAVGSAIGFAKRTWQSLCRLRRWALSIDDDGRSGVTDGSTMRDFSSSDRREINTSRAARRTSATGSSGREGNG
ncbi:hypothetical protein AG1IA_08336 [Rhizoctonia solani AG-1 IA]|uniref:Uncharacterized protein n=1 Tax=Thanatephorus cucumeris (strain AG1-IA) TaxID=983506 RepID=L8WLD3_THACA|nr:hypothetical protein AG1IA_08336 [Rhizoctonia solani AG-1 IA]